MLRSNNLLLLVIAVMMALFMLGSCGKKGPLYLPDDSPAPKQLQTKN